jgi:hypothetical protein
MRIPILAMAAMAATQPAQAQTYDPNYPVCLRVYGPISYNDCRYQTLAQCAVSAGGRGAECVTNPFFAHAQEPAPRPYRRHRHVY